MRATSSSSAISRVSRSASALTVSSIIFFWSSLSLSHLDSSVATKPLTPVSGERSSWATVATRSERSRSSRSRARAERSDTATCRTGLARARRAAMPGGDQQLGAVGEVPRLLGQVGAGGEPVVGLGAGEPAVAGAVLRAARTSARCLPTPSPEPQQPGGRGVDRGHRRRRRRRPRRRPAARRAGPSVDAVVMAVTVVSSPPCGGCGRSSAGQRRVGGRGRRWARARGVEADGGRGGQVEALGAAVDRDPDPVVGQRGELVGQAPGLVAEQPGGRARRAARRRRRRRGRARRPRRPRARSGRGRAARRTTSDVRRARRRRGRWNSEPTEARTALPL